MSVKIKLPKVSADKQKLFADAIRHYKNSDYDQCYSVIRSMAEDNVPRACYCKALLDINPKISCAEGDAAFVSGMKKAASLKYPLAYGALALYYYESDMYNELVELCVANKKVSEPRLSAILFSLYDGFYTEGEKYHNEKLATKSIALTEAIYHGAFKSANGGALEWEENDLYAGVKLSLSQSYALFNRFLMISYKFSAIYSNRTLYREAYNKVCDYAIDTLFIYAVNHFNAQTLMDDVMGLSDLKSVNKSMRIMEEAYQKLTEGTKEVNYEDYSQIWENYNVYYESEMERLASLNLQTTSDLTALFPGSTISDFVSDLATGVKNWANAPSASVTEDCYEIDGVKYKKGDNLGYLYDENGIRSNYRVDDVDRLYGESDKEIGHFSTDGIFMSN